MRRKRPARRGQSSRQPLAEEQPPQFPAQPAEDQPPQFPAQPVEEQPPQFPAQPAEEQPPQFPALPAEEQPPQSPAQPAEEQPRQSPAQPADDEPAPSASTRARASVLGKRKRESTSNEDEYFEEQRNLEDLWKQVFPAGTEWEKMDKIYKFKWNFSNLEEALEEGGDLYNRKVYLFGCTETVTAPVEGEEDILIPIVVAVLCPFPPSEKLGITSDEGQESIVPMKQMKMDWVPYIPLEKRASKLESIKRSQIFILKCTQRRIGFRQLNSERVKNFDNCIPYFHNPFKEASTEITIKFPLDSEDTDSKSKEKDSQEEDPKQVVCQYNWKTDELKAFTNKLIAEGQLPGGKKKQFKALVKKEVRKARLAISKGKEDISGEAEAAFENMKFYKFYPVSTPDTPDNFEKSTFINKYYGDAHTVI